MLLLGTNRLTGREQVYELLSRGAEELWGFKTLPLIQKGERGKPYFPQYPGCHFNLSHSGRWGLCGLGEEALGVDIQQARAWRPGLLERVCSRAEREWLSQRGDRPEAFALLWALKESLGKQSGYGISYPPSRVAVPLPQGPGDAPGAGELLTRDGLYFRVFGGAGWRGAVCAPAPPPGEIVWAGEREQTGI